MDRWPRGLRAEPSHLSFGYGSHEPVLLRMALARSLQRVPIIPDLFPSQPATLQRVFMPPRMCSGYLQMFPTLPFSQGISHGDSRREEGPWSLKARRRCGGRKCPSLVPRVSISCKLGDRSMSDVETRRASPSESGPSSSEGSAATGEAAMQPGLYTKFVAHFMRRVGECMPLTDFPIREGWRVLRGRDGPGGPDAVCRSTAASSHKVRFMRSADISAGRNLQVLNLVAFPHPTYDLPYFCADLVTFPRGHLIVIDLNPLFQTEAYLDKYISPVLPLCLKYSNVLPWGGEFTAEALQFFSPALLWSRLPLDHDVAAGPVFDAFADYLEVWLAMVRECEEETDPAAVAAIREAQHRYMCWRSEKDPGRPVLTRLFGSERCEEYLHGFLFDGLTSLGTGGFLDYFPQYRLPDGSICRKRSMAGKSYTARPWDEQGRLIL